MIRLPMPYCGAGIQSRIPIQADCFEIATHLIPSHSKWTCRSAKNSSLEHTFSRLQTELVHRFFQYSIRLPWCRTRIHNVQYPLPLLFSQTDNAIRMKWYQLPLHHFPSPKRDQYLPTLPRLINPLPLFLPLKPFSQAESFGYPACERIYIRTGITSSYRISS